MKILSNNRRVFGWFCVYPLPESATMATHLRRIIVTIVFLIAMIWSVVSAGIFIVRVIADDLNAALYALFHFTGILHSLYTAVLCFIMRARIQALFDDFQEVFDKCELEFIQNVILQ